MRISPKRIMILAVGAAVVGLVVGGIVRATRHQPLLPAAGMRSLATSPALWVVLGVALLVIVASIGSTIRGRLLVRSIARTAGDDDVYLVRAVQVASAQTSLPFYRALKIGPGRLSLWSDAVEPDLETAYRSLIAESEPSGGSRLVAELREGDLSFELVNRNPLLPLGMGKARRAEFLERFGGSTASRVK